MLIAVAFLCWCGGIACASSLFTTWVAMRLAGRPLPFPLFGICISLAIASASAIYLLAKEAELRALFLWL